MILAGGGVATQGEAKEGVHVNESRHVNINSREPGVQVKGDEREEEKGENAHGYTAEAMGPRVTKPGWDLGGAIYDQYVIGSHVTDKIQKRHHG